MDIDLIDFGPEVKKLLPIARLTVKTVRIRMPAIPPMGDRPIKCFYRPNERPRMILGDTDGYSINSSDHYRIHVNTADHFYGRFVFQLSHELGHLMFEPRRNNGVIEIFAVALSFQVLKDVAKRWQVKPPLGHTANEAYICRQYAKLEIQHELSAANADQQTRELFTRCNKDELAEYARMHAADQDADPCNRVLNIAGALALMPEMPWPDLVGIGKHTVPSPDSEPGECTTPLNLEALPLRVQNALRRIGREPLAKP